MNNTIECKPGQYAIITVLLQGPEGERLGLGVGGEIVAPGLAITPEVGADENGNVMYEGGFHLVHIASGQNVAGIAHFGGHCIACIREYADAATASGIDWTLPMERTQSAFNAGGEGVEALKRAYADLSACGGTHCGDVDGY